MDGHFAHNPEPLPENLSELSSEVVKGNYDLGIAVDPDVDRLSFVCEDGTFFGEEYTLVSIADYWLSHYPGNTVSNLSSSRALRDITLKYGGKYSAAAVGEINVVEEMLKTNAVVGGEGNGGVIIPDLHYGRDALAGIALFLSQMAATGKKVSEIRSQYPDYFISKNKILLDPSIDVDEVLSQFHILHKNEDINTLDGIKVDFADYWIHLRRSNTEPIIRIYSEAKSAETARKLAATTINQIENIIKAKV
jgi:phosphomannomutase